MSLAIPQQPLCAVCVEGNRRYNSATLGAGTSGESVATLDIIQSHYSKSLFYDLQSASPGFD